VANEPLAQNSMMDDRVLQDLIISVLAGMAAASFLVGLYLQHAYH